MPRYTREGKRIVNRTPKPEPPRELTQAINAAGVKLRVLVRERDDLEDTVATLRRQLRAADDELDQFGRSRLPSQVVRKRRLEQYRDNLAARLGGVRSELDATERSITETTAALAAYDRAARQSLRPAEALDTDCPECGHPSSPHRTAPAGKGWRQGWFGCAADCGAMWTAKWTGGDQPIVKIGL